jgi:hypothetical protein
VERRHVVPGVAETLHLLAAMTALGAAAGFAVTRIVPTAPPIAVIEGMPA